MEALEAKAMEAVQEAERLYGIAIHTRQVFDSMADHVPVDRPELHMVAIKAQEKITDTINAAWRAKRDAEDFLETVRACRA